MKKVLSVFLAAVMLLAMLPATALAAGEITVNVQAEKELTALEAGDVVTVTVVLPAVTATNKLQLDLNYDNAFFTYNGDAKSDAVLSKLIIGKVEASGENVVRLAAAGMMTTADFEAGTVAMEASFTVNEDAAGQSETFYLSGLNCGDATVTASAAKTTVGIAAAAPAPHEHAYDAGVETTPATCAAEGVKTFTCACGDTYTVAIEKLTTHTWDDGVETTPATETTTGVKTFTCTVCGETKDEEIPMLPTTPVVGDPIIVVVEEEATGEDELVLSFVLENNAGFKGYGLTVEYDEDNFTLKALKAGELSEGAFTANVDEAYVNYASASEVTGDGVLFTAIFDTSAVAVGEYEFTVSGTMADADYVKAEVEVTPYEVTYICPGHVWGEWEVVTPATCTEKGEKIRTCTICGETQTAVIPATGHTWGDDDICDDCGAQKPAHSIRPVGPNGEADDVIVLPFTDVAASDWFYSDVMYVYANGLMNGVSATEFAPYGITTRGQIVTILWRLEGQPAVIGACPFTDVAAGSYYETAITWAAANGIVTGYDATTFGPNDQITREQMAAILYRYAVGKELASVDAANNLVIFNDANMISGYAMEAMNWAVGQGLINGMGDGTVAPQGNAIRAQAAAILHRFCEALELL